MNTLLAVAESDVGGLFMTLLIIGGLALAITWIVFPFIVINKLNRLIRAMEHR